MELIIVTGMSGSGKSTAFKIIEDFGYFCVDNLPAKLIDKVIEMAMDNPKSMGKMALGVDIRGGNNLAQVTVVLDSLFEKHMAFQMVYFDASDECLLKRYKESRRAHPLGEEYPRLEEAISKERKQLEPLRKRADYVIDTSHLLTRDLHKQLKQLFVTKDQSYRNLNVTVMSFGFKYGIPTDADLVFDVRFLPNPFYNMELRPLTGNDRVIQDYVMNNQVAEKFMWKLTDLMKFLIPQYINEGKNQLVIAVGCTGGKHRSVTVANRLYEVLIQDDSYGCNIFHRDILQGKG